MRNARWWCLVAAVGHMGCGARTIGSGSGAGSGAGSGTTDGTQTDAGDDTGTPGTGATTGTTGGHTASQDTNESLCGDGNVDPGEECDDGNLDDNDGCDADCTRTRVVDLAVGWKHTCVVFDAGGLRCWGLGYAGQLGQGVGQCVSCSPGPCCSGDDEHPRDTPLVPVGMTVSRVVAGGAFTCARSDAGNMRCWGSGLFGQLGTANSVGCGSCDPMRCCIGDDEIPADVPQVEVGGIVDDVVAGNDHVCARLGSDIRCWGRGDRGVLGYGNTNRIGDDEHPAAAGPVDLGGPVLQVVAGRDHNCALMAGGVVCWGFARYGRLGYADLADAGDCEWCYGEPECCRGDDELPWEQGFVDIGGEVEQLAAGGARTCALMAGGDVRCWGINDSGQLGLGHTDNIGDDETPATAGPVDVGGAAAVVGITMGEKHACVLLEDGAVRCWGYNEKGQLGLGHIDNIGDDEPPSAAANVDIGGPVILLRAGHHHTCAVLTTGAVRCWGWGYNGQLGHATIEDIGDDEHPSTWGDIELL